MGSSGDSVQNRFVGNLREVSTLDIGSNTVQGSSQGILGRSVHHLGSDWSGVWRPGEENNLRSLAFTSTNLVLEVVDGVFTFVFWQLFQEYIVVGFTGGFFDDNFCLAVVQGVDDELVLLAQL